MSFLKVNQSHVLIMVGHMHAVLFFIQKQKLPVIADLVLLIKNALFILIVLLAF